MPVTRMRYTYLTALLIACSTTWAGDTMRVDGTSPTAFAASQKRLMRSLSPGDAALLAASEAMICAAATPKPLKYGPTGLPMFVPLEAVRSKLNGMTFDEIVRYAESLPPPKLEAQPSKNSAPKDKVGFFTEPASNNRPSGHDTSNK